VGTVVTRTYLHGNDLTAREIQDASTEINRWVAEVPALSVYAHLNGFRIRHAMHLAIIVDPNEEHAGRIVYQQVGKCHGNGANILRFDTLWLALHETVFGIFKPPGKSFIKWVVHGASLLWPPWVLDLTDAPKE
jgi:hypothetical protein